VKKNKFHALIKRQIKSTIPERYHANLLEKPYIKLREFIYFSKFRKQLDNLGFRRYCPVCRSWLKSFEPFGIIPRPDALCPIRRLPQQQPDRWRKGVRPLATVPGGGVVLWSEDLARAPACSPGVA
jgi:hypothetical protein